MAARVFASPNARRLARDAGLRVEDLKGSGPNGRIIGRDVEAFRASPKRVVVRQIRVRCTVGSRRLLKLRERLNRDENLPITLDDLVVRAAARAHRLVLKTDAPVNLTVATPSEQGVATSLLKAADTTPLSAVAAALRRPAEGDGTEGGALTVMSLAEQGTEDFDITFDPSPPMVLTVGAARGDVLRATLAVDPRVIDITTAATWMRTFGGLLDNPVRVLL